MIIKSMLVVAAHPDDEVLGCGATISRFVSEGIECHCAILSEGIASRYDEGAGVPQKELDQLAANTEKAANIVGYSSMHRFKFPDNQFDTVPLLDITKTVESLMAEFNPDTVMTHHAGDLNRDHQLVHRAVLTATRPVSDCKVNNILAFEIPSSSEWAFSQFSNFRPNYFVDVENSLENKISAMAAYEGESRVFPHPRSEKSLRALAVSRGASVGMRAAEAFEVVRLLT